MAKSKKNKFLDDGDDFTLERQFHRNVKRLVRDTVNLFKDDQDLKKLVKKGKYEDVSEYVFDQRRAQTEFPGRSSTGFVEELDGLALRWFSVIAAAEAMPSLTWPIVKI